MILPPPRSQVDTRCNPLDHFRCCWCGNWFPWTVVGCFDGRRRWCDGCCDQYERIVNPPVFKEAAP